MRFQGDYTKEIIFPLGGIGTGSIGFSGNGRLKDIEIFNRPAKGSINGYSHLALRAESEAGVFAKVLNGDELKDLMGQYGHYHQYQGYGYGPEAATMVGIDHFDHWEFEGEFPLASLRLSDQTFPGTAEVRVFNPMIPGDAYNSSIPAAFFELEVRNTSAVPQKYTAAFSFRNPFPVSRNILLPDGKSIFMKHQGVSEEDLSYGDLTLSGDGGEVFRVADWYRGGWQDGIATFLREFFTEEGLHERCYGTDGAYDTCTLAVSADAEPGEEKVFRFVLSWNIPNNYNYWDPVKKPDGKDVSWKNWYAAVWPDSRASNVYAFEHFDELLARTRAFHDALWDSTLDPVIIDAAASTLSVLHSPTVWRLEDGSFYGWEGSREVDGSCEGSCTHVWNYAYALCFLFPDLERSMRTLDYTLNVQEHGAMRFRLQLPPGRKAPYQMPCLDGQMGGIIKLYRDWMLSGDDEWLRKLWPAAKKSLEFAWNPENPCLWDENKDGVLEGRQHHTLDMELFGPSAWLQSMYLAALDAGARIAEYLGEADSAAEYRALFAQGRRFTNEELFNGSWFIQKIDLSDRDMLKRYENAKSPVQQISFWDDYWNPETQEIKYQQGEGCAIDQMLGEWHGGISGLTEIFDQEKKRTALQTMFRNNFHTSFRHFTNPWRNYYLNDEAGAIICAFPEGARKPAIPAPYTEETMHGFEYSFAGLLLENDFYKEAVKVIHGVRDRYDGRKRNPYNEMECGNNYARSMAAFSFLPIMTGMIFDLPHRTFGFCPRKQPETDHFRAFFALGKAWGRVEEDRFGLKITFLEGSLPADTLALPGISTVREVRMDGAKVPFTFENGKVYLSVEKMSGVIEVLR